MRTSIYVMAHKPFDPPKLQGYIPLRVGAALSDDDYGFCRDDEGENISEKNLNYNELTGAYWMWKNADCDIIGLCHYRRYFFEDGHLLPIERVEEIMKKYDVILPASGMVDFEDLDTHYRNYHIGSDLDLVREVIMELTPDYIDAFDLCMHCRLFTLGSMVITKKEIFDRYCEWLFHIFFEMESRLDMSGREDYQRRVFGFMGERMLRVFFMRNSYHVREVYADVAEEGYYDK